jgi:pimeloyl-ACP methyl ester carboxylesterase
MRSRRPRRLVAFALAATAVATLLAGCFTLPFPTPHGTDTPQSVQTGAPEKVAADLQRFYSQSLTWHSIGSGLDASTIEVPLDWSRPTGATIKIAFSRHRATGSRIGSLLVNPGGPGASGYDFVAQSAGYVATKDVLAHYDLIGFDPRGVGRSTPITCYTDPKQQDELLYGTYDQPYFSTGWAAELGQREQAWVAACQKNTGALLGHLDAASVARDMDVLRAVLGDATMHYLGYSYGTYLGTMYAELFPQKVGRMVLDGAVDPKVDQLDALATQMAGFDSALKAYMTDCLAGSGCPWTGSVDQGMAEVRSVLDTVDAQHLTSSDGRTLDSATLATAISETLYSQDLWIDLTQMMETLRTGDPDEVFGQADAYNNRNGDGTYDGNGTEIYTAVTCDETTIGTDGVDVMGDLAKLDAAAPVLGKYMALDDTAALEAACDAWPTKPATLPTTFDAKGAKPIVVIGTTNDPATPYAQSVSLSKQLSSGFLFTHHGEGHTVYAQGDTCIDSNVDTYLLNGTLPAGDPDCH